MLLAALSSCVGTKPSAPERPEAPVSFRWRPTTLQPLRLVLLDSGGRFVECRVDERSGQPCDVVLAGSREVFFHSRTSVPVGVLEPDLSFRGGDEGSTQFSLAPSGDLVGLGPFHSPGATRVLNCRLTEGPVLRCEHTRSDELRKRVTNLDGCLDFEARVDDGAILVSFPEHSASAPVRTAIVEPAALGAEMKAVALSLYAMHLVADDTERHTPGVERLRAR